MKWEGNNQPKGMRVKMIRKDHYWNLLNMTRVEVRKGAPFFVPFSVKKYIYQQEDPKRNGGR